MDSETVFPLECGSALLCRFGLDCFVLFLTVRD